MANNSHARLEGTSRLDAGATPSTFGDVAASAWGPDSQISRLGSNSNLDRHNIQQFGNVEIVDPYKSSTPRTAERTRDFRPTDVAQQRPEAREFTGVRVAQRAESPHPVQDQFRQRIEREQPRTSDGLNRFLPEEAKRSVDALGRAGSRADLEKVMQKLPKRFGQEDIDAPSMASALNKSVRENGLQDRYRFSGDSTGNLTLNEVSTKPKESRVAQAKMPEDLGNSNPDRRAMSDKATTFARELSQATTPEAAQKALRSVTEQMKQIGAGPLDAQQALQKAIRDNGLNYKVNASSSGDVNLIQIGTEQEIKPLITTKYKPS